MVTAAVRRVNRLQGYVLAFAIAITLTALIAIFLPAANAAIYFDKLPTKVSVWPNGQHSYFPVLEGLRAGTLRTVSFDAMDGLISFPSFHTANAILILWALWPITLVRWMLLPINILLIASTPLCGAHYFVDVLGGCAVAFVAISATARLTCLHQVQTREMPISDVAHNQQR
jgi:membrane-associated phospholipid phosphatase